MFRYYLKNTVFSPATAVGIFGFWLAMIAGTTFLGGMLYSYQLGLALGATAYFIPVAPVLPICYMERQMRSGNIWHLCIIRSSRRSYVLSALFAAILSGMVVSLGAFALFTVTSYLLSPSPHLGHGMGGLPPTQPIYIFLEAHPAIHYLEFGMIFVLNGALCPAISLVFWSFFNNQYVALAAPFALWLGLSICAQHLHLFYLDPVQCTLKGIANQLPGGGIPYAILYISVVNLICGVLWYMSLTRRVKHG